MALTKQEIYLLPKTFANFLIKLSDVSEIFPVVSSEINEILDCGANFLIKLYNIESNLATQSIQESKLLPDFCFDMRDLTEYPEDRLPLPPAKLCLNHFGDLLLP